MSDASHTIEQALTLLRDTPIRLAALTADLSPEVLQMRPGPEEWSVNEVLAHLCACADVWGDSIRRILSEDQPTWRAVSPRTWIKRTDYPERDFRSLLATFMRQRADLLAVLDPLPLDAWERSALVSKSGKTLERTALSYAEQLIAHEKPHIEQIESIVNTMQIR